MKITKICENCKKEYNAYFKKQRTCSKECHKEIVSGTNSYWHGKNIPEEIRIKMRKPKSTTINMHATKSEEHKKRVSETRKRLYKEGKLIGYSGEDNPMYGKVPWNKGIPRNEEERKKMSETKLKRYSFEYLSLIGKEARKKSIVPLKDTKIEVKIQQFLESLQIDFFTHKYITEIEHGYQCDIFVPSLNLVIECDGDYWHKYPTGNDIDHIRTKELIDKGFKVLRLWEHEINDMDINKFKEKIL